MVETNMMLRRLLDSLERAETTKVNMPVPISLFEWSIRRKRVCHRRSLCKAEEASISNVP
jgi:hypothetical protein